MYSLSTQYNTQSSFYLSPQFLLTWYQSHVWWPKTSLSSPTAALLSPRNFLFLFSFFLIFFSSYREPLGKEQPADHPPLGEEQPADQPNTIYKVHSPTFSLQFLTKRLSLLESHNHLTVIFSTITIDEVTLNSSILDQNLI